MGMNNSANVINAFRELVGFLAEKLFIFTYKNATI